MIHSDEDDEFERILRENQMKGQPYHFEKREWIDLDIQEVDPLCEKYKDQPHKLYVEIRNLLKEKNT